MDGPSKLTVDGRYPERSLVRPGLLDVNHRQLTPLFRLALDTLALGLGFAHDFLQFGVSQLRQRSGRILDGTMLHCPG